MSIQGFHSSTLSEVPSFKKFVNSLSGVLFCSYQLEHYLVIQPDSELILHVYFTFNNSLTLRVHFTRKSENAMN